MGTRQSTTVYYDGHCPVCSREVSAYRRLARNATIDWLDLSAAEGQSIDLGFDLDAAYRLLHVRGADKELHVGFDAHLVMWQCLPGFRWLAWTLRRCRPGRNLAERIYLWLAARRPGLQRRRTARARANA